MYDFQMETTSYYENEARQNHPEVKDEWVEQVIYNPYHTEVQENGRISHWGFIEESDKWLRVIVEDDKLFNLFFDRIALRRWGKP